MAWRRDTLFGRLTVIFFRKAMPLTPKRLYYDARIALSDAATSFGLSEYLGNLDLNIINYYDGM
jgi:hypothetical protein